jgi:hypothetical protein
MSYPPYSPDLAACDFRLFETLKNKWEGNRFASEMNVKWNVREIAMDIPLHVFISEFDEWMRRLHEYIDSQGEYV